MQLRRFAWCALLVGSCGKGPAAVPDAEVDAAPDAPDAGTDRVPPTLLAVTPESGSAAWLHERIRLVFDEPVTFDGTVTATLAGAPIAAQLVADSPDAVAVEIDPAVRGLGALVVHVEGTVRDAAGNATALPVDAAYDVPAWSGLPLDGAQGAPRIAVADSGAVYAAWSNGQQIVVAMLDRGQWTPLGDPLGTGVPSLALDASARPYVAWSDGGVAHVARWDGAWSELASPGSGTRVLLASTATGNCIVAAVFGGAASVRLLANDSWQSLGDVAIAAPIAGEPALAAASPSFLAIGWIDAGALRVWRYTGSWAQLPPIAGTIGHISLAARSQTLAVAWDQLAGSYGVLAARAIGTMPVWTRLGHTLDVDVAGEAVSPAIALDASNAPIVAWTELIEGKQRGVVALFSGAWTILGGRTFLADATAVPTGTQLALYRAQMPVVAWTANGALGVARFNGPAIADVGIAARQSIAGCSVSATNPPALLSQTGCFTIATPGKPAPHPGLVPYDVVVELWTDGAKKRRWIGLPDGAPPMTLSATGAWTPANGTVMVKEFAIETTPGNPATRRAIETRFLVKDPALGWQGFSYRWRLDGTDATLQPDQTLTFDWPMDAGPPHTHVYPSRSECLSCHENSYGPLLGVRPQQLQRWYDYGGVIADQLPTLAHLGVGPASTAVPFISPHDPSETSEHRMRGYMAANCAHCHNPNHIAIWDARYTTPLAQTNLCSKIVPGDPPDSIVYQKVSTRPGMPPLGTASVDPLAVAMLGDWITRMTSCP